MAYGNKAETVWPSIKPMDPYPIEYSTCNDDWNGKDTVNNTPTWDSLPLTDDNPANCVTMYTTLDQALFPSECALESIVETLPSGVAMKAVSVPMVCVCAFIDLCKGHGCAVFTTDQWTDLHK